MARKGAGPILACLCGAAMLAWTWGTWPDLLVGFGEEIALAWRVAEGDVLYRDLEHAGGPLSPCLNATAFRAFGTSLATLVAVNLAVLAGIAVLLHRLLERIAGALAAAVGLVAFLTLFAFAQSNYVCPSSHGETHGLLIALLALAALERRIASGRIAWTAAAGFLLGLAYLASPDVFLALAAALALGVVGDRRRIALDLLLLAGCGAVPVAASQALLGSFRSDWPDLRDVLADRPRANAVELLAIAGRWLVWIGPAALLALAWRRGRSYGWPLAVGIAAGLGLAIFHATRVAPGAWLDLARPLPLVAALALAGWLIALRARHPRAVLAAASSLFALVLLARLGLRARITGPGFALAMPAAMIAVAALVGWMPALLDRLGGRGAFFRGAALGVLAVAVQAHLAIHQAFLERKTTTVGEGADAFLADDRGGVVNAALATLRARLAPGATLAVLPEGAMLQFLLRAPPSTRYLAFDSDEAAVADAIRRSPPDLVALVHRPEGFGEGYGDELLSILRDGYSAGTLIGGEPFRPGTAFGIRLYALRR